MKLSKRLQSILDMVPQDAVLADIGTDHGLLIVKALLDQKVSYAYALDIAKKPLESALKNVEHFGLSEKVSLQLRNGLEDFEGHANCFVIAGMGAETILGIIKGYSFKHDDVILIQSNTKVPFLRESLGFLGFKIDDEVFLIDKKIPTTIIKCRFTGTSHSLDLQDRWIGPILRNKHDAVYHDYLESRMAHLSVIMHHDSQLNIEYQQIKEFLKK